MLKQHYTKASGVAQTIPYPPTQLELVNRLICIYVTKNSMNSQSEEKTRLCGSGGTRKSDEMLKFPREEEGKRKKKRNEGKRKEN